MKPHYVVALLVVVALSAAGYALMAWQHATLPHDEAGHEEADTHETASPNAPASGTAVHGSVAGAPAGVAPAPTPGTDHAPASTPAPLDGVALALTVSSQRQEAAQPPLVTITLAPLDAPLSLKGWRLSDAIGRGGIADHVYYFGDLSLDAGQTLTIHSACGRDEGLTRFWCMNQPLSLLDAASKALYLVDPNGAVALTCTPDDPGQASMAYACH